MNIWGRSQRNITKGNLPLEFNNHDKFTFSGRLKLIFCLGVQVH